MVVRELVVSDTAAFQYPLLKRVAEQGVNDVAHVTSRHLANLTHDRQRIYDFAVAQSPIKNVIEREQLVLWNSDDLDIVAVDRLKHIRLDNTDLPFLRWKRDLSNARL